MFDFLKKKISSWLSNPKEKESKKENETAKSIKPKKASKTKPKKDNEKELDSGLKKLEKDLKKESENAKPADSLEKDYEVESEEGEEYENKSNIEIKKKEEEDSEFIEEIKIEDLGEQKEESKGNFFSKILNKITQEKLSQEDFDENFSEFEITLLENNVALEAVDRIKENLSKNLVGQQIKRSEAESKILSTLKESISSVLLEPPNLIDAIKKHQGIYTIIFFGINGTGKTTSVAKIANMLKKAGISSVLAAADTFRAASIEQLKVHSDKLGIPIISSNYGADPASVAFEAKKYAQSNGIKVVLVDTAGRMYTKENLLKEMEKIMRVAKPDLKIFVGESITGNDAIDQAKTFNDTVGIDGIILSKADVDEKAGTILSVSHITGKPIYFLGTGQGYDDLQLFSKKTVLKHLGLD